MSSQSKSKVLPFLLVAVIVIALAVIIARAGGRRAEVPGAGLTTERQWLEYELQEYQALLDGEEDPQVRAELEEEIRVVRELLADLAD